MAWFKPQWYKPLGQFFELASVIFLVGLLGLFWLQLSNVATLIIAAFDIVFAFCLFLAAVICLTQATKNSDAEAKNANSIKHVISDARLLVLKEEKIPRDAFEVLKKLNHSDLFFDGVNGGVSSKNSTENNSHPSEETFTKAQLLGKLREGLGKARTEEVKELILKYTVKDEEPAKDPADSSGQKPTSQPKEPAAAATDPT
jgi:phosphoglycerol transferase MdoB-like AlkP superfamily enzyme